MIQQALPETSAATRPPTGMAAPDPVTVRPPAVWRSLFILLLGVLIGVAYWLKPPLTLPPQAGVVMQLPGYVNSNGGFFGSPAQVTPEERHILPKDTEFARKIYRDLPGPDEIYCSIVLTGAMQESIHRPEICLVAQGWNIVNQEEIPIQLKSGRQLVVRNLTIRREVLFHGQPLTLTAYNMYWFVGEKITTPSHVERVFLTSWDRIVHNRAHRWAYVTVLSEISQGLRPGGLDAAQTREMMVNFIREVVRSFQKEEMADATATTP